MAFFFGDGFDLYAAPADAVSGGTYWDSTSNLAFTLGAGRFTGSRAAISNGAAGWLTKTSTVTSDAVHHLSIAYYQTAALTGTTTTFYCNLFDGATAQCTISIQQGGNIILQASTGGATLATYTGAVGAINTWYQFEFEVVINNTTGAFRVRKNGNTSNDYDSGATLNTRQTTSNQANKITCGCALTGAAAITVDDLLWRSDASSVPWVGDIRCFTRMPASDASVAWSRGPAIPYTLGNTSNASPITANQVRYTPFTPTFSGTIGSVTVGIQTTSTASLACAIYASSAGSPTTALGTATPINAPAASNTANVFTFSTPVSVTAGTPYFIAVCGSATSGNYTTVTSGTNPTGTTTYASFPVNNPTSLSANGATVYLVYALAPSANWPMVSEAQQDGATSYNYSSTVSQSDLYGIAAIGSTPSSIVGVTTRGYFQKSDAGTRNVAVQLQSGATNVQSASTALNTTFAWIYRNDLVDPATGAAWTATGVNNATIGAIVTA